MKQGFLSSNRLGLMACAGILAVAALLALPAGGQKPAGVSGQVVVTIDGQQKFPTGAHVVLMYSRPASVSYSEKKTTFTFNNKQTTHAESNKDAALAEWNGFWPADFYSKDWSERLFAPLRDKNRTSQDAQEYYKASTEGRLAEYKAKREERNCRDKADAVDLAIAATLQQAQQEKKEHLIVSASTDDNGKFAFPSIQPGRFSLIVRARIEPLEISWIKEGEVVAGKSVAISVSDPLFTCKTPVEEKK